MTTPEDYPGKSTAVAARPVIYAHRGSSLLRPENTAIAFDWALRVGARVLETDVRLSRDQRVMVVHDERLDRTTDGYGTVRSHTAETIVRLDAGYRFQDPDGRSWRGEGARIESLESLFERYPMVRINIDIKDRDTIAADRVAEAIERADRCDNVTVGSFHNAVLQHFRRRSPRVATAASKREVVSLYFRRGIGRGDGLSALPVSTRPGLPYRFLQIPMRHAGLSLATPAFIATARAHGIEPVYWTINDEARMRTLIARGAAGIVTDRPDLLATLLSGDAAPLHGGGP